MPKAKLLHNPRAGDKDHSKENLIKLIDDAGFNPDYASIKEEGWEQITPDTDMVVIVGGDGTVRKAAKAILKTDMHCPYLIGLLPFGTANNIAKTLKIHGDIKDIVQSWHNKKTAPFDVTYVSGLEQPVLFLEGFGYGIFPQLMKDMKLLDKKELDTPEKELKKALEVLKEIVLNYEGRECIITVDDETISGCYLLVEAMNICSIGPNLHLAPAAQPGDGLLELVLLPEKQRRQFADHLQHLIDGNDCPDFPYQTHTGKSITLKWMGTDLHADDELLEYQHPAKVSLAIKPGLMEFLVP
ncbi:diacylglycerol kinase [Mucilaginibacter sp. UR6-1]|uniref:diacylglycerol/lipid kinase family protein n=1 Tax=Mucilaginibacter sp. UR6-1 TaxID=1435643 RepID=UPI001E285147|nr:diacylglycerol kinase family protein [Mucilaginibacter sp. UR6-1]MCC8409945.1 diacylglycerol kinase [Mucilaginibacter sp. UR6-1]